jgi:hypothetical protein
MIDSYSSLRNLGHASLGDLFKAPVLIEEKIDGSQFSFRKDMVTGEIEFRSKGAAINPVAPEKMFSLGVAYVLSIADSLIPGYTYRGEYLKTPKHNVNVYERTPLNHVMIFDIQNQHGNYLTPRAKLLAAHQLGLETVPRFFEGMVDNVADLRTYFDRTSALGGQKIEGIVIKPLAYDLFGRDGKLVIAKFVSESFKEVHAAEWKQEHGTPGSKEIIQLMAGMYGTPARWAKALIHLREKNSIIGEMKDIPFLLQEVVRDVESDSTEEIKQQLFDWAMPQLRRMIVRGLPQWYKDELAKSQFATEVAA